jgi:hypothetical protein
MQSTIGKPAAWQSLIDVRHPERQDERFARHAAFQMRDAVSKLLDNP